jgi:hypothetical protein
MRALLGLLLGLEILFSGLGFAHAAPSETAHPATVATDHDWISKNPRYKIPPVYTTHCCGAQHCRPARELGVQVIRELDGGYLVMANGTTVRNSKHFPQDWTYQTEADGNGEFWICALAGEAMCLFVPPLGM